MTKTIVEDKPQKYVVIIKNRDNETREDFENEKEAMSLVEKALELKKKAKSLEVKLRVSYGDDFLYAPHEREAIMLNGEPLKNPNGRIMRRVYKMPVVKGKMYCPECGYHTVFKRNAEYGLKLCTMCGLSENEFYFKTCNGTWETLSKKKQK